MLLHAEIKNKGIPLLFKNLPVECQKAIIFFMAVDGEAWLDVIGENAPESDDDWSTAIKNATQHYGGMPFIIYDMPVDVFKELIMQTPSDFASEFDTFEDYHADYVSGGGVPNYPSDKRWPALAWDLDEEGIVDGWHRLHSYVRKGHKTIPLIL